MLITESNNLYGWGYNGNGELGLGNVIDQTTPQKIILPNQEKPLSISLGISNSATITVEGNLYAWGYNNYGQLGIGNTTYQITPKLVTMPNGEKPISIALGGYHTMVTTDKDNFYTWGSNNYGQLGIGNNTNQLVPIKVTLP